MDNLEKWKKEILPDWENKKGSAYVRDMVNTFIFFQIYKNLIFEKNKIWKGIPQCLRGKVWPLLLGNRLRITKELYLINCIRSNETVKKNFENKDTSGKNHEDTVNLIPVDIGRTFPQLGFFQEGGPCHDQLLHILQAFVCYRPDIGYVQGMSFIAAHLLLQMDPEISFCCMANMLSKSIFNSFFTFNMVNIRKYCLIFEELLKNNLPAVSKQFEMLEIKSDMYLIDWIMTIFAKSLPLEIVGRIWDIYLLEGDSAIYRCALTVLAYRKDFLSTAEFGDILKYLNRPSSFKLCEATFFELIHQFRLPINFIKESYNKYNLNNQF